MVKLPTKSVERTLLAEGYGCIIGLDEVGMACLAGPVVVCALAASPEFYAKRHASLAGMRDSKTLQAHQRERFAAALKEIPGLHWCVAVCDRETIDRINIYQASRVAMRNAVAELRTQPIPPDPFVIVDGNKLVKGLELPQRAIIKGDRKVWAVAAASVIAKVHRDRLMTEYAREYPGYGFEVHKGYPTAMHRASLARLGPCTLHRRSFAGVVPVDLTHIEE